MTGAWVIVALFGIAFAMAVLVAPLCRAGFERIGDAVRARRMARDTGERLPWRHER